MFAFITKKDQKFLEMYNITSGYWTDKYGKKLHQNPIVDGNAIEKLLKKLHIQKLIQKNINEKNIDKLLREFNYNNEGEGNIEYFHNLLNSPPLILKNYLNKKISITEICDTFNIPNPNNFLVDFKFDTNPPMGSFEAFIILSFKDVKASNKGDALYDKNGLEKTIEIKGIAGRIRGHSGYRNGIANKLNHFLRSKGAKIAKKDTDYNIKYRLIELNEYKKNIKKELNDKMIENQQISNQKKERLNKIQNKNTKKYKTAYKSYNNFVKNPFGERVILKKLTKIENKIDSCVLENFSVKSGREQSIKYFTTIFLEKYEKAHVNDIIDFLEKALDKNGYFSLNFYKEWLIFEFLYYQQIEEFSYFCITNKKYFIIIASLEKFKELVYGDIIGIISKPSFCPNSGNQGEVFSIKLN